MGEVLVGWCVPRAGVWGFHGHALSSWGPQCGPTPPGARLGCLLCPPASCPGHGWMLQTTMDRCPWLGPSLHPSSSFQGTGHMETREAGPEAYGGPVWLGTAVTFQRPAGPGGWGGCNTALWPWPWREHEAGIRDVPGSPGLILQVPHLSVSPASHVGPGHPEPSLITASRIDFTHHLSACVHLHYHAPRETLQLVQCESAGLFRAQMDRAKYVFTVKEPCLIFTFF